MRRAHLFRWFRRTPAGHPGCTAGLGLARARLACAVGHAVPMATDRLLLARRHADARPRAEGMGLMRTVDEIIAAIKAHPSIPPIHKQIMINRLDPEPTQEEIEAARRQVYDILLGEER